MASGPTEAHGQHMQEDEDSCEAPEPQAQQSQGHALSAPDPSDLRLTTPHGLLLITGPRPKVHAPGEEVPRDQHGGSPGRSNPLPIFEASPHGWPG